MVHPCLSDGGGVDLGLEHRACAGRGHTPSSQLQRAVEWSWLNVRDPWEPRGSVAPLLPLPWVSYRSVSARDPFADRSNAMISFFPAAFVITNTAPDFALDSADAVTETKLPIVMAAAAQPPVTLNISAPYIVRSC